MPSIEYTASAAQGINEEILEPIRDLFHIVSFIGDLLPIRRKKRWFKK